MFSRLFGRTNSTPAQTRSPEQQPHDQEIAVDEQPTSVHTEPPISIEIEVETGGGKGWPADASVFIHHRSEGVVCVGTSGGAVYSYGDGFQYFRPFLVEKANEVVTMVPLHPDKLLVAFADNSLAVLQLPHLRVLDLIEGSWLDRKSGSISIIHVDEAGEKPFVYVGTNTGIVFVCDVNIAGSLRICEYKITLQDVGISQPMAISGLQICPKDERYLAVGYDGPTEESGATVIFDLVKHKSHKVFTTAAVACVCWTHTGEVLFAGTRTGELLSMGVDKAAPTVAWHSRSERHSTGDEDSAPIVIRKAQWLPPQESSSTGCVFLLLGACGEGSENMKNNIVGLAPIGPHGDLQDVFALPPLMGEIIVGFRFVPTISKNTQAVPSSSASAPTAAAKSVSHAGLLLLTERSQDGEDDRVFRQLKMLRCPLGDMTEWGLEIGMTPDPVVLSDVLPSKSLVTCVTGLIPSANPTALATVLCHEGISRASGSQGLSSREFFAINSSRGGEDEFGDVLGGCELVLARAMLTAQDARKLQAQDVVFLGHDDGSIVAWGVSRPPIASKEFGRGNAWLPLKYFQCGTTAITAMASDDMSGLFVAGGGGGNITLHEIYDSETQEGFVCRQNSLLKPAPKPDNTLNLNTQLPEDEDEDGGGGDGFEPAQNLVLPFRPNAVRSVSSVTVDSAVSSLLLIADLVTVIVGTAKGDVYVWSHIDAEMSPSSPSGSTGMMLKVPNLNKAGATGAVTSLWYSSYWRFDTIVPAVYVTFGSGHVAIVHPVSAELLAFNTGQAPDRNNGEGSTRVAIGCVVDSDNCVVPRLLPVQALPHLSAALDDEECASGASSPAGAASPGTITSKGSSSFFRRTSEPPPRSGSITSSRSPAKQTVQPAPASAPACLILLCGRSLVTLDILKFAVPTKPGAITFTQPCSAAVKSKIISQENMTAGQVIAYVEEATRAWSTPIPCLSCVNSSGNMLTIRIKDRAPVCHSSLLDNCLEKPIALSSGVVLSNGDCYLVNFGTMVYTATPISNTHIMTQSLPSMFSSSALAPQSSLQLSTGREKLLAATAAAVRKRRQSVITITSGPTDLEKLFSKTQAQRQSEDLLRGSRIDEEDGGDDEGISKAHLKKTTIGAKATLATMNETRDAFAERGEKLSQIVQKMDSFKNSAQEYRDRTAAIKAELIAKNARWGMF